MPIRLLTTVPLALLVSGLAAADLKPDATSEIPASAKREVVIKLDKSQISNLRSQIPKAELPAGFELQVAAASPLVTHPIMGCLDDRGRLFVGDATGVNWNKKQLEENPPNRILMLEDTDGDGTYDKSTIFADKMTFPQGGCWFDGSLYVCSPPGVWKLTDSDSDGVADKREMIVGGFEYTGNAADVHGPWLHPNGRLYWCHGRKGHKVVQKDGTLVHEGLASGIWSCKPDGGDVQWHSLGCGDNPVKVDFTPGGEIIGVQNIYYSQPRGDSLVHWLYGGVYERSDQLKAIEGLPRTLEHMPVMYNFGHVAVSGCCFWKSFPTRNQEPVTQNLLVTHFNTQRVVRMELTPDGATYKAAEHEFLRLPDSPDVHFTDVMEAADGSLLVVDTGGWFRIGCPSSLMAKPDIAGAVYRVKRSAGTPPAKSLAEKQPGRRGPSTDLLADLRSGSPPRQLHACERLAQSRAVDGAAKDALYQVLNGPLDPTLEHAAMNALIRHQWSALGELHKGPKNPDYIRRLLIIAENSPADASGNEINKSAARDNMDSEDPALARTALGVVTRLPDALEWTSPMLAQWLDAPAVSPARLAALEGFCTALLAKPGTQDLVRQMLAHATPSLRQAAWRVLASQTASIANDAWFPPLEDSVNQARPGDLPLLLDAIKKLKSERFNPKLQMIAEDTKQMLPLRLKALDAMKGLKLTPQTFTMLHQVLTGATASAAARIQAAGMLAAAPLDNSQLTGLAPLFGTLGPVELKELFPLVRKTKDVALVRSMSSQLAKNPALASMQESLYRTAFSDKPAEIFETILLPAIRGANEAIETKKRLLPALAEKAAAQGVAAEGRRHFEAGKGTCIACHKVGDLGRALGPDLGKIGAIRTERDLLESILFPSNTLARDYEAHIIETGDGQSIVGVIKSHTAEGLLVMDAAGQEKTVPHGSIVANTTLSTSLMPLGLDQTLNEKELCDLVAYLRSLK